jgi:hypothetical protein
VLQLEKTKKVGPGGIKQPGPNQFLSGTWARATLLAAGINADLSLRPITHMIVAMLAPVVMTVDPMMTMVRPMAGHPNHFVIAFPVTRTMAVVWPITEFDAKPCRLNGGPESEARNANRHEQY